MIDLNPRPYGSLALAIGSGLKLPAVWADLLLGREPRLGAYRVGVRCRAEIREGRALVLVRRRGRWPMRSRSCGHTAGPCTRCSRCAIRHRCSSCSSGAATGSRAA